MKRAPLLFLNVFVIATCGLIYELLAGTLSSLRPRRLGHSILDHHRHLSFRDGRRLVALAIYREEPRARNLSRSSWRSRSSAGSQHRSCSSTFAHLSYFSDRALRRRVCDRRARRARDTAADADTRRTSSISRTWSRACSPSTTSARWSRRCCSRFFSCPKLGLNRTSLLFGMLNAAIGIWGTWLLLPLIKRSVTLLRVKGCGRSSCCSRSRS